jgi:hypothetical protein
LIPTIRPVEPPKHRNGVVFFASLVGSPGNPSAFELEHV